MIILGVSGMAGSGFDTDAAAVLANEGYLIVNADDCVDDAWLSPDVRIQVAQTFGTDLFDNVDNPDPTTWRRKRGALGAIVAKDPVAQELLNQLLQPFVTLAALARLRRSAPTKLAAAFIAPRLAHFFHILCHATLFIDRAESTRKREVEDFYHDRGFENDEYTRAKVEHTLAVQRDVKRPGEFHYDYVIEHPENLAAFRAAVREVARRVLSTRYIEAIPPPSDPLVLSVHSSGGQFLRAALSLSELSQIPVTFDGFVSASNKKPLQLADLCQICSTFLGGHLTSAVSASSLTYAPGGDHPNGDVQIDAPLGTSIAPLLQLVLPVCVHGSEDLTLHLRGHTELSRSAPADYFSAVFFPLLSRTGARASFALHERGFEGGPPGEVSIGIRRARNPRFADFTKRGDPTNLAISLNANAIPGDCLDDCRERLRRELRDISLPLHVDLRTFSQDGPAALSMSAVLQTEHSILGVDAVTEGPASLESINSATARLLTAISGLLDSAAAVDPFFADQILIYLLCSGGSVTTPLGANDAHVYSQVRLLNSFRNDLVTLDVGPRALVLHVKPLRPPR